MILSNFKLQNLGILSITKFCQNFILILPTWRIPITIALDLQQALITPKLNVKLKKAIELWPLLDQEYGVRFRVMLNQFHQGAPKP